MRRYKTLTCISNRIHYSENLNVKDLHDQLKTQDKLPMIYFKDMIKKESYKCTWWHKDHENDGQTQKHGASLSHSTCDFRRYCRCIRRKAAQQNIQAIRQSEKAQASMAS